MNMEKNSIPCGKYRYFISIKHIGINKVIIKKENIDSISSKLLNPCIKNNTYIKHVNNSTNG
tara:strand:+ start:1896 stop:2081 length:186 start_codon:yes stop_codon:yes gene_type:complete